MSKHGLKNPVPTRKARILKAALSPYTFGIVGSVVAIRTLPGLHTKLDYIPTTVLRGVNLRESVGTFAKVGVGYGAGLAVREFLSWLRLRGIKSLLAYHGWLFNQNSTATKVGK